MAVDAETEPGTARAEAGGTIDTLPLRGPASHVRTSADAAERWIGRILAGRYTIERVIGRGGMGYVFEAKHATVGRRVAVKILRPEMARNPEAVSRFHREAQAAAAIGHQNIVEIVDFGYSEEGDAFLVMELLEGDDLHSLVKREGPLDPARAASIARQTAGALRAAHNTGIVHRDLKSANVFVVRREGRDFVKVVDFGVSKVLDPEGEQGPSTHQGTLLGTPHYMAPEQGTDGRNVDHRADLYALGCILFETLTGELPFTGATPVEVVYKHVHERPRRPSDLRPGIPRALDDLVVRLLAKSRDDRPADASAVCAALDRTVAAPARRRTLHVIVVSGLVAGLAVVAITAASSAPAPRPKPPPAAARAPAVVVDAAPPAQPTPAGPVVLTVVVRPEGARLLVDGAGADASAGVLVLRADRGAVRTVRAEADGFVARQERVALDGDTTLRWTLTPVAAAHVNRPAHAPPAAVDAGAPAPRGPDELRPSPYEER